MTIRFKMVAPDGEVGEVASDDIHDALNDGFKLHTSQRTFKMVAPDGEVGEVASDDIHDALNDGFKLQTEANFSDKVQSFAQGVSGAIGGVGDFITGGAANLAGSLLPAVPTNTGNEGMEQAFSPIASMKQGVSDAGSKIWEEKPLEHLQRQGVGAVAGAIGGENAKKYITEDTGLEHIDSVKHSKVAGEFAGTLGIGAIEKGMQSLIGSGAKELATKGVMIETAKGLIKNRTAHTADNMLSTASKIITDFSKKMLSGVGNVAIEGAGGYGASYATTKAEEKELGASGTIGATILGYLLSTTALKVGGAKVVDSVTSTIKNINLKEIGIDTSKLKKSEITFLEKVANNINLEKAETLEKSGMPLALDILLEDKDLNKVVNKLSKDAYKGAMEKVNNDIIDKLKNSKIIENVAEGEARGLVKTHYKETTEYYNAEFARALNASQTEFTLPDSINAFNNTLGKYKLYEIDNVLKDAGFSSNISKTFKAMLNGEKFNGFNWNNVRTALRDTIFMKADKLDDGARNILTTMYHAMNEEIPNLKNVHKEADIKILSEDFIKANKDMAEFYSTIDNLDITKSIISEKFDDKMLTYYLDINHPSNLDQLDTFFKASNIPNSKEVHNAFREALYTNYIDLNLSNKIKDSNYNAVRSKILHSENYLKKLLGEGGYNKFKDTLSPYLKERARVSAESKNIPEKLSSTIEDTLSTVGAGFGSGVAGTLGAMGGQRIGRAVGKTIDKFINKDKVLSNDELLNMITSEEFVSKIINAKKELPKVEKKGGLRFLRDNAKLPSKKQMLPVTKNIVEGHDRRK